jgi:hypothetical protein
MYLYYELNQFIKNLPAGQPLAIYWQSRESNLNAQFFETGFIFLPHPTDSLCPSSECRGTYGLAPENSQLGLKATEAFLAAKSLQLDFAPCVQG